ncbi:Phosphoglycerate mutase-like protein AT74 [Forsythia ovata]|uniref:Phosphoglycerate mutase-like protein AT74 n=1 Tax=Forsythia ovata TaxID=205694 RepID=A0ABD1WYI9_9LAMI
MHSVFGSDSMKNTEKYMPKRIILVRHGESEGNENEEVLEYVPNYKIKLSNKGIQQAQNVGSKIKKVISENGESENWKVLFYVSPSERTKQTLERIIGEKFPEDKVIGLKEECRLREQHFGNFQDLEKRKKIKRTRNRYGKFFYRVPDGESSADVYDRVSSKFLAFHFLIKNLTYAQFAHITSIFSRPGFLETLWREMETNRLNNKNPSEELNLIIVSHGLTILLFLMKWFNWTVEQFHGLSNPSNCEYRVLQLGCNGEYSLAMHHKLEELRAWGLSEEMIHDQIFRAYGTKKNLKSTIFLPKSDVFFDDKENSDEFLEENGSKTKRKLAYINQKA